MTGLLRKDLYYVKAYAWPYLPLLALLCLSPGAMGPAYAMALAGAGAMVLSFRVSVGFYRARLRGRFG